MNKLKVMAQNIVWRNQTSNIKVRNIKINKYSIQEVNSHLGISTSITQQNKFKQKSSAIDI